MSANMKRILVPIDSSEIAERAMQEAIKVNRFGEAEVHVLYVADINKLAINAYLSGNVLLEIGKAGERILNAALEKFPESMKVVKVYRTGDPAETITEYAIKFTAQATRRKPSRNTPRKLMLI